MEKRRRMENDEPVTLGSDFRATLLMNQEQIIQYICTVGRLCEGIFATFERMEERLRRLEERTTQLDELQRENGDLRAQLAICEEELQKRVVRERSLTQHQDFM